MSSSTRSRTSRTGPKGRKRDEHLLEEVFRLACRYIGQSPKQSLYLDEIKRVMHANLGWQRILAYLKFLDATLLVRLIEPLELRLKRARGPSKLCLCDHALRAAWLQEVIPLDESGLEANPHLRDLAGRIAESTVGYFFRSLTDLDVAHFPERGPEPEVDFILTIGEQRIPVEVKYRSHIEFPDTRGLRSFIEKSVYNASLGLLAVVMIDPCLRNRSHATLQFRHRLLCTPLGACWNHTRMRKPDEPTGCSVKRERRTVPPSYPLMPVSSQI